MQSLDRRSEHTLPAETEFDPKGVAFLREHGLQIVPGDQFSVPVGKPYIVATDSSSFRLQYDTYSSKSAVYIIDHSRQTSLNSLQLLLNTLSAYAGELERETSRGWHRIFHLEEGEAMQVQLDSLGWEKVFHLAEQEFPGTITWPQKPAEFA